MALAPAPTPLFLNWPSADNIPFFSAVDAHGHIKTGDSVSGSATTKPLAFIKYPVIQFSTAGILSGRPINIDEPPVKVMANVPMGDHCCIYALPTDISLKEFSEAVDEACLVEPMSKISWPHVKVSPRHGLGIIGVENAGELAILSEVTILIRGQPLVPRQVVRRKDTFAYIVVTRLAITSFEKRTTSIAEVLGPYGKIVDIIFERQGRTIYDHVKVILDRKMDMPIPRRLMIGSIEAVLSIKKVRF
ncbi:hypothetical protein H4S07_003266 [Coemansia furcata]|uniref:Uncharacterized protein n=1 Tax=Coemansia furcata TaxID=417177 RepID=A0ACC1LIC2_9FUNG|nr:hypothetical protein H4S07_003266 [Coemansia furcata]